MTVNIKAIVFNQKNGTPLKNVKIQAVEAGTTDVAEIATSNKNGIAEFTSLDNSKDYFFLGPPEATIVRSLVAEIVELLSNTSVLTRLDGDTLSSEHVATSTTYADSGLSKQVTTNGGRILVFFWGARDPLQVPDTPGSTSGVAGQYKCVRDSTDLADEYEDGVGVQVDSGSDVEAVGVTMASVMIFDDTPSAGAHTYKIQHRISSSSGADAQDTLRAGARMEIYEVRSLSSLFS